MDSFIKRFEVGWSELDPNRHLANTAYMAYMNNTRMSLFNSFGVNQDVLHKMELGPVVLSEHFFYLKEVSPSESIIVDVELIGNSKNKRVFRFAHHLYIHGGEIACFAYLDFGFIDLNSRKLVEATGPVADCFEGMPKSSSFQILSESDFQKHPSIPRDRIYT